MSKHHDEDRLEVPMLTESERKSNRYTAKDQTRTLKDVQGSIFSLGAAILTAGWLVSYLGKLPREDPIDNTAWSLVGYALLQTVGLLIVIVADVDVNLYLKHNRRRLVLFALNWVCDCALLALYPPTTFTYQLYWLPTLPYVVLFAFFTPICDMKDGYPQVANLVSVGFILTIVQGGLLDIFAHGLHSEEWATARVMLGGVVVFEALCMSAYYLYNPHRWNGTVRLRWVLMVFLLCQGLRAVLIAVWDGYFAQEPTRPMKGKGLLYGLISCSLPLLAICFRKPIRRYLGRRWLHSYTILIHYLQVPRTALATLIHYTHSLFAGT
jgi:hypothetical protein